MLEYIAFLTLALGSVGICFLIASKINNMINAFSKWLEKRAYGKAYKPSKNYSSYTLDDAKAYRNEIWQCVFLSIICPPSAVVFLPIAYMAYDLASKIELAHTSH